MRALLSLLIVLPAMAWAAAAPATSPAATSPAATAPAARAPLAGAPLAGAPAPRSPILAAIRADRWPQAAFLAAAAADPLAARLVEFYRLLAPGAAGADEIAAFLAAHPDWPLRPLLSRRLQEALARDPDQTAVRRLCPLAAEQVPALLRCAETASDAAAAAGFARRAWVAGPADPEWEGAFLQRWGGALTREDQWRRFDRLAWSEPATTREGPAARQAGRLAPEDRPVAEAWLALRRDQPTAPALVRALPVPRQSDPALVLDLARWYRRAGQDADAARVWAGPGAAAEQGAPSQRRAAFWAERNLLARHLLRVNGPALAYQVVAGPASDPAAALEQEFLAGWIALRRLDRAQVAADHFRRLATLSPAALTQSRAFYWLGRALDGAAASAAFAAAATWPTTFYGQMAALRLGHDPGAVLGQARDPAWDEARALAFLGSEQARAALLLTAWGEARRSRPFLQSLAAASPDPSGRALAARLALGLGVADEAVMIARRAGSAGIALPESGWPVPVQPPQGEVEAALVLALIRQESSFDLEAVSPSGARGLMQLMPATAGEVSRGLGLAADAAALTSDAAYNMRLGTAYLASLLERFDHVLPVAIAAYNAGPRRVQEWLGGDLPPPGPDAAAMIDWIELIPFAETRNYVQRVIENLVIYRARLNRPAPHPVLGSGAG